MKTFTVHANHQRLPGPSLHEYQYPQVPPCPPPPAPPPPPVIPNPLAPAKITSGSGWCPHVELPHTMRWVNPGQHKLTSTVFANGSAMAQDGHDVGTMILHVPIPANVATPIVILFSKYQIVFSASSVKLQGKAAGTFFPALAPPMYCAEPCAFPAVGITNTMVPLPCTVFAGMTLKDFGLGWGAVFFSMAMDMIFKWLFGDFAPKWFLKQRKALQDALKWLIAKLLVKVMEPVLKTLLEKVLQKFLQGELKTIVKSLLKAIGKGLSNPFLPLPVIGDPRRLFEVLAAPLRSEAGRAGTTRMLVLDDPGTSESFDALMIGDAPHAA